MRTCNSFHWSARLVGSFLVTALMVLATSATWADKPPGAGVRVVAFSPDGRWLVAGTGEPKEPGTITLWEVAARKPMWTHTEKAGVPAVAFAPDGATMAVAVYDGNARLLDTARGQVKATLAHPKEVRGVAFSPDGKRLATTCWDQVIRVWDVAAATEKLTCTGHRDRIFTVAFSPDGKHLLSAGGDDGAKLWDAATGAEKRTWKHGPFYVPCAAFSPDGRWALTGGYDGTLRVLNIETGAQRIRFSGTGGIGSFAFSPAARMLAVCGHGREVSLFPLTFDEPTAQEQERVRALLARLDDDSYDVREAASKDMLALGIVAEPELWRAVQQSESAEVRIRARRVRQEMLSQPRTRLVGHTDRIESAAFTPDGKLLASGGKDGTVRLWDVANLKEIALLTPAGNER